MRPVNASTRAIALLLAIGLPTAVCAAEEMFLCRSGEQLIFGCSIDDGMISICASTEPAPDGGYMQYRSGSRGRIQFTYPSELEPPKGRFFLSTVGYSGGGGATIRFVDEGSEYFVFDLMVRTNFVSGEPNYPAFNAGVITRRNGRTTSVQLCDDSSASIRAPAYDVLPREEYYSDVIPPPRQEQAEGRAGKEP